MAKAKEQSEEEAIERFRNFLGLERKTAFAITGRDVEVNSVTHENFDYQLQSQDGAKIAVELFRLIESGEELARQKVFSEFVEKLKTELLTRGVKGYFISTPEFLLKKRDIPAYTARIATELEQAVKNNGEAKEFEHASYEFTKISSLESIAFSYSSGARNIDPRGTAASIFASKLPKKNKQVAVPDHERMILVVNWTAYISGEDVIRALSGFDFSVYENIDKIYFERREGEFELVYDRTVVDAIQNKQLIPDISADSLMLQYARYQLGEKKPEADNGAKENLISYGEDLVAKDQLDEAMWIVRQLENDPNPNSSGANEIDDPEGEDNYHAKILSGEEVKYIVTVRGRLCWLMMKIAAKSQPKYYTELIRIMSRYLSEENLYIRTQATYILGVLWSNRRATKNADESPFEWNDEERKQIHDLTLRTVRANRAYPRVIQALLDVFNKMRDLSEEEAEEILTLSINTEHDDVLHNLAPYVVYFALFRERDSQFYGDTFRSARFIEIFKDQITNGKDAMSSTLAWHIWKLLTDKVLPYTVLREYIVLFLEGKYSSGAMTKLALIFEELVAIAPEDAATFYERALESLEEYLKTKPADGYQHWINATEEILPILAKEPNRLIAVVERLKNIWMTGMNIYIGNIQTIFGSYELVPSEHKEEVRTKSKAMYDEMKAVHPPLQEVDWTK